MRCLILFVVLFITSTGYSQFLTKLDETRMLKVQDSIQLEKNSIQSKGFSLRDKNLKPLDSTKYHVDFSKSILYLKSQQIKSDSLKVSYLKYPSFLTQKYFTLSDSLIVPKNKGIQRFYKLSQSNTQNSFQLFDGLNTSGSISRGITIGSNQNSVFNSQLDLQISGKISENVTLKASLQDTNIPIQEGGYSQSLDEFDQVFIELTGKKWSVRAGDVQFSEQESVFSSFTKKLQGLLVGVELGGEKIETKAYASGALVRGVYNFSAITGQEGNQGPYKLIGQSGELFVLIVSGSERVYVNGLLLQRGQNKDYVIDYNAGEVTFNTTYPVTSDMRIIVEYQVSQQNYARIFGVAGAKMKAEKWQLNAFVYSENDLENQTLQQDLNDAQKQLLSEAGDDQDKMISPSVIETEFTEDSVLYLNNGSDASPIYSFFQGDADPGEPLYQLRFSNVGQGNGDYNLSENVNQVYEYTAPINGIKQGTYEPVIQLQAPIKLQIGVVQGKYTPSNKTDIKFELAASQNDLNLFSRQDNEDNKGGAVQLQLEQQLYAQDSTALKVRSNASVDYVNKNFRSVERFYNIEFFRDWNLDLENSDQLLTNVGLQVVHSQKAKINYDLEYLDFEDQYKGVRHLLTSAVNIKKWQITHNSSALNSDGIAADTRFLRGYTRAVYGTAKFWSGAKWSFESNKETDKTTNQLSLESQAFNSYEIFSGVGDSTKVYVNAGVRYRENDSIYNSKLQRVTKSNTLFVNSTLVNTPKSRLSTYVNYRIQNDIREPEADKNLNTRLLYRQTLWDSKLQLNSLFETQSGTFAQQEFTYVEVDAGNGTYAWNDYNGDGIQDFDEFEVSVFKDEAIYVRVLLPSQTFLKTYQNKYSQQVGLNLSSWRNSEMGLLKLASHFYNQTSYIIDRKTLKDGNDLNFNVFRDTDEDVGLNSNFRNSLFFNRGKQQYSTTYNFSTSKVNTVLVSGRQSNNIKSHELAFVHKIRESWLIGFNLRENETISTAENLISQNYKIKAISLNPRLSYLFGNQSNVYLDYSLVDKENESLTQEVLLQQKLSIGLRLTTKEKGTFTTSVDWYENDFTGDAFSAIGYQLLEGLQPGTNFTWKLLAQKKITKFLELNLDYTGRKSDESKTIHTGSVQLRAFF